MRIGYSVLNTAVGPYGRGTLNVRPIDSAGWWDAFAGNLDRLERILAFNVEHGLLLYRVPHDLVPDDSRLPDGGGREEQQSGRLERIGRFCRQHRLRLTVHPDLFVLLNAEERRVAERSVAELGRLARLFDLAGLDQDARIQIHIGDKGRSREAGLERFIATVRELPERVRRRLAIENDCVVYDLSDCLKASRATGLPVVLDVLHHRVRCSGEPLERAMALAAATWGPKDGPPLVDFSSQAPGRMPGKHAEEFDPDEFRAFIGATRAFDFDCMLEMKDRERGALRALELLRGDPRLL